MAKLSIDVHSRENTPEKTITADAVSLVVDTLGAIGMSDKEACLTMRYDASRFSKAKVGEDRIPVDALWRMPDAFWLEFIERARIARGLSQESKRAQRAARIGELIKLLVEEVA